VVAIDPGRSKCGLTFVEKSNTTHVERSIVPTERLIASLSILLRQHPEVTVILIGSGTGSATLARAIREALPMHQLIVVDEKGTSIIARQRYLEDNPPKGWMRFLPRGLRTPPEPYDDYAALLLAERYLES
jgi:RNase H-fold protein (predicted Holliday junction resolvase)